MKPENGEVKVVNKLPTTYICDKKPGACKSWEKYGWEKCESEYCSHTTNKDHALFVGIDVKGV